MADTQITDLTELTTPAADDLLAIVDKSDTTMDAAGTDKKITTTNLLGYFGGWIPAAATWSYASATTITVPSGAASKYQKGDKIKITQTTDKYFYVVGVADTVLTVTGGNDYTVADAAITSPCYSKIENPQGFPDWFDWSTGCNPQGFSAFDEKYCMFRIMGRTVQIWGTIRGTSDATTMSSSLPVSSANISSGYVYNNYSIARDNGSNLVPLGMAQISNNASVINFYTTTAAGTFTSSGNKGFYRFLLTYRF